MKIRLLLLVTIITLPTFLCNADREVNIDKDSLLCYIQPPENLPEESWEFTYSILKSIKYPESLQGGGGEELQDTTIKISAGVDNTALSFKTK